MCSFSNPEKRRGVSPKVSPDELDLEGITLTQPDN